MIGMKAISKGSKRLGCDGAAAAAEEMREMEMEMFRPVPVHSLWSTCHQVTCSLC